MKLVEGKVAVITGGASVRGIGRATAQLFAHHGARVAILDIDARGASEAAAQIGEGHIGMRCDLTDRAACEGAVAAVIGAYGHIDVLVNNAGISRPARLMEISAQEYEAVMDTNLRGTLNMSQAVVPAMRARRSGAIVNVASVAAQRGGGLFGGPHYAASKGGVLALTKAMARELAPDNVRVNAVCPSLIDTDIFAGGLDAGRLAEIVRSIPMGRPGHAAEVAGCILFLASELASYVTGAELDVNGGSHIH